MRPWSKVSPQELVRNVGRDEKHGDVMVLLNLECEK